MNKLIKVNAYITLKIKEIIPALKYGDVRYISYSIVYELP